MQVKVQTVPGFASGLHDGMPKFIQQEGVAGLGPYMHLPLSSYVLQDKCLQVQLSQQAL